MSIFQKQQTIIKYLFDTRREVPAHFELYKKYLEETGDISSPKYIAQDMKEVISDFGTEWARTIDLSDEQIDLFIGSNFVKKCIFPHTDTRDQFVDYVTKMRSFTELETVELQGVSRSVAFLTHFKKLKSLFISCYRKTSAGQWGSLVPIEKPPKLQGLSGIVGLPIEFFQLEGCELTEQDADIIFSLPLKEIVAPIYKIPRLFEFLETHQIQAKISHHSREHCDIYTREQYLDYVRKERKRSADYQRKSELEQRIRKEVTSRLQTEV